MLQGTACCPEVCGPEMPGRSLGAWDVTNKGVVISWERRFPISGLKERHPQL